MQITDVVTINEGNQGKYLGEDLSIIKPGIVTITGGANLVETSVSVSDEGELLVKYDGAVDIISVGSKGVATVSGSVKEIDVTAEGKLDISITNPKNKIGSIYAYGTVSEDPTIANSYAYLNFLDGAADGVVFGRKDEPHNAYVRATVSANAIVTFATTAVGANIGVGTRLEVEAGATVKNANFASISTQETSDDEKSELILHVGTGTNFSGYLADTRVSVTASAKNLFLSAGNGEIGLPYDFRMFVEKGGSASGTQYATFKNEILQYNKSFLVANETFLQASNGGKLSKITAWNGGTVVLSDNGVLNGAQVLGLGRVRLGYEMVFVKGEMGEPDSWVQKEVQLGGKATNITVSGGEISQKAGTLEKVTLSGYVSDPGTEKEHVLLGALSVNGGYAGNITLQDYAMMNINGGTVEKVTVKGSNLADSTPSVVISGGYTYNLTLTPGKGKTASLSVSNGLAKVEKIVANSGATVSATAGNLSDVTLKSGSILDVQGEASTLTNVKVNKGAAATVYDLANISDSTVFSGGTLNLKVTPNEDGTVTKGSATANNITVKSGGVMSVAEGAKAYNTTLANGAVMNITLAANTAWTGTFNKRKFSYVGKDIDAVYLTKTQKAVSKAANVKDGLLDGGTLTADNGSKLTNIAVGAKGHLSFLDGVDAEKIRIYKNGIISFTAARATNPDFPDEIVYADTSASRVQGSSGYIAFEYGAGFYDISVTSTQKFTVGNGGIAKDIVVTKGATFEVGAQGTLSNVSVSKGATLQLLKNSKLTGQVSLDGNVSSTYAIIDFDLTNRTVADGPCITNLNKVFNSSNSFQIHLASNQMAGEYVLATNAGNFNGEVSLLQYVFGKNTEMSDYEFYETAVNSKIKGREVKMTLGQTYEVIPESSEESDLEGYKYTLFLDKKNQLILKVEAPEAGYADDKFRDVIVASGMNADSSTYIHTGDNIFVTCEIANYGNDTKDGTIAYCLKDMISGKEIWKGLDFDLKSSKTESFRYAENGGEKAVFTGVAAGIYELSVIVNGADKLTRTIVVNDKNTADPEISLYHNSGMKGEEEYAGANVKKTFLTGYLDAGIYSFGRLNFDADFTGTITLLNESLKKTVSLSVKKGVVSEAGVVLEAGYYAVQLQGKNATSYEFELIAGDVFATTLTRYQRNADGSFKMEMDPVTQELHKVPLEDPDQPQNVKNATNWIAARHVNKSTHVAEMDIAQKGQTAGTEVFNTVLKVGDKIAFTELDFRGNNALNLYNFGVESVGGDDKLKVTLYTLTNDSKLKAIKTITTQADTDLYTTPIQIEQAENVRYFVSVENLNAAKGVSSDVIIMAYAENSLFTMNNNDDDVMTGSQRLNNTETGEVIAQYTDWIGYTDSVDWFTFDITADSLGSYTFSLDGTDFAKAAKVTVYRAIDNGKGYLPIGSDVPGDTDALKAIVTSSSGAETKAVNLLEGRYYIKVENLNKKSVVKNTAYTLNVNAVENTEFTQLFPAKLYTDVLASAEAKQYYFKLDSYYDVAFATVTGITLYQDNGSNGMKKISLSSKNSTLTLGPGTYYISTTAKVPTGAMITRSASLFQENVYAQTEDTKVLAGKVYYKYDSTFGYQVAQLTVGDPITDEYYEVVFDITNDKWQTATVLDFNYSDSGLNKKNAWVGYGDATDYYTFTVDEKNSGSYKLSIKNVAAGSAVYSIFRVTEDANGIRTLTSMLKKTTLSKTEVEYELKNLLSGEYVVMVQSAAGETVGITKTDKMTGYSISATADIYRELVTQSEWKEGRYFAIETATQFEAGRTYYLDENDRYVLLTDSTAFDPANAVWIEKNASVPEDVFDKSGKTSYAVTNDGGTTFFSTERTVNGDNYLTFKVEGPTVVTFSAEITALSMNDGTGKMVSLTHSSNGAILDSGIYYVKVKDADKLYIQTSPLVQPEEALTFGVTGYFGGKGDLMSSTKENPTASADWVKDISGWVGLGDAEDEYIATMNHVLEDVSSDGLGEFGEMSISLTVTGGTTTDVTTLTLTVYELSGTKWTEVGKQDYIATYEYNEEEGKYQYVMTGGAITYDTKWGATYKYVVSTSDKGKGDCNATYKISGTLDEKKDAGDVTGDENSYSLLYTDTASGTLKVSGELSDNCLGKGAGLYSGVFFVSGPTMIKFSDKEGGLISLNDGSFEKSIELKGDEDDSVVLGRGAYRFTSEAEYTELPVGTLVNIQNKGDTFTMEFDEAQGNKRTIKEDVKTDWVGVSNTTDTFYFSTYDLDVAGDLAGSGWGTFGIESVTNTLMEKTQLDLVLSKNVNGAWKVVGTGSFVSGGGSASAISVSLEKDTEYKLEVVANDAKSGGAGSANATYTLNCSIDMYDYENDSLLTAKSITKAGETDINKHAIVVTSADKVDNYKLSDVANMTIKTETKDSSVSIVLYDENFNVVKYKNQTKITISGESGKAEFNLVDPKIAYVQVTSVGKQSNPYTITGNAVNYNPDNNTIGSATVLGYEENEWQATVLDGKDEIDYYNLTGDDWATNIAAAIAQELDGLEMTVETHGSVTVRIWDLSGNQVGDALELSGSESVLDSKNFTLGAIGYISIESSEEDVKSHYTLSVGVKE